MSRLVLINVRQALRGMKSNHITILFVSIFLHGCVTQIPYDYSALLASQPRSILVIPPRNNTVEVDAEYTFLSTISRPLAEKGYYVFPVSVVDFLFKENGLQTSEEMNSVPLDKLDQVLAPDAVLYITIDDWGQKYQLISSTSVVNARMKLVDVKTGDILWAAKAYAERSSGDGGGGLSGALAAAIVEQVLGSINDQTPELSRVANTRVINNANSGLLNGPYRPAD